MRHVTLGRMPDGRWLVEHSDVRVPSLAYWDEQRARQRVADLTAGDRWVEVPVRFGPGHEPTDPGWRRAGGTWVRDDRSEQAPEQGQAE